MLDQNQKDLITQQHCWTAEIEMRLLHERHGEMLRPFHLMKPKLFIDGNQWCALYGDNLQEGVAGFGDSPADAACAFDKAFNEKLPAKSGVRS